MSEFTAIEAIAGVYLTGAHLCVRDDAELGILATSEQQDTLHRTGLFDAVREHRDEVRESVLLGIHNVIDGYLPALDGLERHQLSEHGGT